MGAPFTAWLFSLHFPNLESWISVDSCQSEHNRTALCSFEPNLSGRTAKELRQLKIPRLPFHKILSIHMLMPQASRASHGVHEGAPPRGPPIWLLWRLVSPAALPSSGLEPSDAWTACVGWIRPQHRHTRHSADGSASTLAFSLRDVAAPLGACSHQRSSAAPGRPCSRTSLMASLMASLMVASRGCHHFVTTFTYHTATARFRACSGALAVPVTFGRPMRPGRASGQREDISMWILLN